MIYKKVISKLPLSIDQDDLTNLAHSGIDAVMFSIPDENYGLAASLMNKVRTSSEQCHKPLGLIQSLPEKFNETDLLFGLKGGTHSAVAQNSDDLKRAMKISRGLKRLIPVLMGSDLYSPPKSKYHFTLTEKPQGFIPVWPNERTKHLAHSLLHIADHAEVPYILVSSLPLAFSLSSYEPDSMIVFVSEVDQGLGVASLIDNVRPYKLTDNLYSNLKSRGIIEKGSRFMDALDHRHTAIHLMQ